MLIRMCEGAYKARMSVSGIDCGALNDINSASTVHFANYFILMKSSFSKMRSEKNLIRKTVVF